MSWRVLIANRLADVAIGPAVAAEPELPVVSEPIFRYRLVVVTAGQSAAARPARQWRWLVDPSGTDPGSETARLLRRAAGRRRQHRGLPEPDRRLGRGGRRAPGSRRPSSTWSRTQLRRGELSLVDLPGFPVEGAGTPPCWSGSSRSTAASALRRFLARRKPCS